MSAHPVTVYILSADRMRRTALFEAVRAITDSPITKVAFVDDVRAMQDVGYQLWIFDYDNLSDGLTIDLISSEALKRSSTINMFLWSTSLPERMLLGELGIAKVLFKTFSSSVADLALANSWLMFNVGHYVPILPNT